MPSKKSEAERCRSTLASGIVSLAFTASRAPRPSGEATSRIASGFSGASLQSVLQGFDQDNVPDYSPKQDFNMFFAVNMASGGLAAAGSLTIVYPLDYARNALLQMSVLEGDLRRVVRLLEKTASGPKGFFSLYAGFGVSLGGSSRIVASSSVPSTPSLASTRTRTTLVSWASSPLLLLHRPRLLRAPVSVIPSTRSSGAFSCRQRNQSSSTSTRAPRTALRRLPQEGHCR